MEYKTSLCLNKTKLLGFHMHRILFEQGLLFHSHPHYIMRSFILRQRTKLPLGINFCFYLIRVFQDFLEQILTHSLFNVLRLV